MAVEVLKNEKRTVVERNGADRSCFVMLETKDLWDTTQSKAAAHTGQLKYAQIFLEGSFGEDI